MQMLIVPPPPAASSASLSKWLVWNFAGGGGDALLCFSHLRTPPCCLPSRIPSISSCELQVIKKYNAHLLARRHGAIATLTTTWITWTDEFEISMKIPKTCILHYAKLHVVPCLYYYHKQLKTSQKKQSLNALYILSFFRHSIYKPWDQTKREERYGKPSPSLRRRRRRESVCVTRKKNARKTAKRFPKSLNPLSLCVMPSFSFINYAQQVRTFLQESGDQSTEAKDTGGGESDTAGGRVSRAGGLGGTRAGGAARLGVRV